jgi:hypothetical protein
VSANIICKRMRRQGFFSVKKMENLSITSIINKILLFSNFYNLYDLLFICDEVFDSLFKEISFGPHFCWNPVFIEF